MNEKDIIKRIVKNLLVLSILLVFLWLFGKKIVLRGGEVSNYYYIL